MDAAVAAMLSGFGTPAADTYAALRERVELIGPFALETKKTCVHFAMGSAFLGIHPRANGLYLTIVTAAPIASSRIRKQEQASRNRCHNDLNVAGPGEVDDELAGWIAAAYSRVTGKA
jgi:hypothetical protein